MCTILTLIRYGGMINLKLKVESGNPMITKKSHMIIVFIYLIFVFLVLNLMLNLSTLVPSEVIRSQKGNVNLTGFDFETSVAILGGEAEFYFNKLLSPDQIDEHIPDSYRINSVSEYTTTRMRFFVPDGEYIIFGESPEYASRIYINGELKVTVGQIDKNGNNIYRVAPVDFVAYPKDGVIELVTHNVSIIRKDTSYYGFRIGEYKTARKYQLCDLVYELILIGIFITCTLFYLGFFMFMPHARTNLWFALISLILALRIVAVDSKLLFAIFPNLNYNFAFFIQNSTLILISTFYVLFLQTLFKVCIPKLFVIITCLVNTLLMALLLLLPIRVTEKYVIVYMIVLFLIMAISIACILVKIKHLKEEEFISFIGQIIFVLSGIVDMLRTTFEIRLFSFISYNTSTIGMLLFVFAQMGALYLYNNRAAENERRLTLENASLERLNHLKTDFLSNVSHEMKTPLTVVSNYAQLTRRHAEQAQLPDEYIVQKMKLVTSEAERMSLMVNQLLEFTRMKSPDIEYHFGWVDIPALICCTMDTYFPILNKNHNTLTLDLSNSLPVVWADETRIIQVLVNLVSNAVKFTKNGKITMGTQLCEDTKSLKIYVEDTGMGMDENQLAHVFERFYTSGLEANSGTGLGLHICEKIIEAHGSKINIQSRYGEGTKVYFLLKTMLLGGSQIETDNSID